MGTRGLGMVAFVGAAFAGFVGCADLLEIPDRKVQSVVATTCTSVKVRILLDETGATSSVSVPYFYGEYDYLRELNQQGGIRNCPIEMPFADYGYDISKANQIYEQWQQDPDWKQVAAVFGFGTGDTLALAPKVIADQKPLISASYSGDLAAPSSINFEKEIPELTAGFQVQRFKQKFASSGYPFNFFAGTDYSTGIRIAIFHAKGFGAKRVGFFHCDQAYCTAPLAAGRSYADELELSIGRDLVLKLTDDQKTYDREVHNYFVQELDEKAKRAARGETYDVVDWVWMGNTSKTMIYLANALDNLKSRARPPSSWGQAVDDSPQLQADLAALNLKVIVNTWGFDENLISACGAPCFERVHGILPFAAYGDTSRGAEMTKVMNLHDKWRANDAQDGGTPDGGPPPTFRNVRYVQGYVSAMLFRLAVERVIDAGKEVNGLNVKEALETFQEVDTGGLTAKISFAPGDHRPQSTETIYKITSEGALSPVQPFPVRTIALEPQWLGW